MKNDNQVTLKQEFLALFLGHLPFADAKDKRVAGNFSNLSNFCDFCSLKSPPRQTKLTRF